MSKHSKPPVPPALMQTPPVEVEQVQSQPIQSHSEEPEVESPKTTEVIMEMPALLDVDDIKDSFFPGKVEVKFKGRRDLQKHLKRLKLSLECKEACMSDGKPVKGAAMALLWLLESHAEAVA